MPNPDLKFRRTATRKGFTIIEIMIAFLIFAIGALGMAAVTVNTIRTNASNALRTRSSSAIQDKIENLRLSIKSGKTISSGQDVTAGLTRVWTVYVNQPSVGLTTVVVQIHWSQAPIKDARFLQYAAVLGND